MSKVDFSDEVYRKHLIKVFKRMQNALNYDEECTLQACDCEVLLKYVLQIESQVFRQKKNKATADKARR